MHVKQSSYRSLKPGKFLEFEMKCSRPGRVLEFLDLDLVMKKPWNFEIGLQENLCLCVCVCVCVCVCWCMAQQKHAHIVRTSLGYQLRKIFSSISQEAPYLQCLNV